MGDIICSRCELSAYWTLVRTDDVMVRRVCGEHIHIELLNLTADQPETVTVGSI